MGVAADDEWSNSEMAEWNASIAKASRRMAEGDGSVDEALRQAAGVGPGPNLRGCSSYLRVAANDIACGSSPFCKVFAIDASNYTDALWCEGAGYKYDRACPVWPLTQGLGRQVVVYRKSTPRLYRFRVEEFKEGQAKLHIEAL